MKFKITCPKCGQPFQVTNKMLGKLVRCQTCNNPFDVPNPPDGSALFNKMRVQAAINQHPTAVGVGDSPLEAVGSLSSSIGSNRISSVEFDDGFVVNQPEPQRRRESQRRQKSQRRRESSRAEETIVSSTSDTGHLGSPESVGLRRPADHSASSNVSGSLGIVRPIDRSPVSPPISIPSSPDRSQNFSARPWARRHGSSTQSQTDEFRFVVVCSTIATTVIVALLLGFAVINVISWLKSDAMPVAEIPVIVDATGEVTVDTRPVPTFPKLGEPVRSLQNGSQMYFVRTSTVNQQTATAPGTFMQFRLYLPRGSKRAIASMGCVLLAPSGTNLLHGRHLNETDVEAEIIPYLDAGYAVVIYSIDGRPSQRLKTMERSSTTRTSKLLAEYNVGYEPFRASQAGVINGKNAIEFVLSRVPQVHPRRIFAAGHGSGGTAALLLAANETRIKGCLAYAPAVDVRKQLDQFCNQPQIENYLKDLKRFLVKSSPINVTDQIGCPVFLFYSTADSQINPKEIVQLQRGIQEKGTDVVRMTTDYGNHYRSMIQSGLSSGVNWLRSVDK